VILPAWHHNPVVRRGTICVGNRRTKPVHKALRECVKGVGVEAPRLFGWTAPGYPLREIACRIALEADRKYAFGRRAKTGLEKIGRLLRKEFCLSRARACSDQHAPLGLPQRFPCARLEVLNALRPPVFGTHSAHSSPSSRPSASFTCSMSALSSAGASSASSSGSIRASAAIWVSGLLLLRKRYGYHLNS